MTNNGPVVIADPLPIRIMYKNKMAMISKYDEIIQVGMISAAKHRHTFIVDSKHCSDILYIIAEKIVVANT